MRLADWIGVLRIGYAAPGREVARRQDLCMVLETESASVSGAAWLSTAENAPAVFDVLGL
jgi:hypothetical protein